MPADAQTEAAPVPPISRKGTLKNGNPAGYPNAAPRCGAKLRKKDRTCRAPAMKNGRCRLHGGLSTGPKTEEGIEAIRAAHWKHGKRSRELDKLRRFVKAATALPDGDTYLDAMLNAGGSSVKELKEKLRKPVALAPTLPPEPSHK